ncbi:glycosyltransferase family 9 protein [Lebetimonas sp. JH292]|uniref:glycosyltransferase family 9 protein n=1 Tax=Lebetimonas sp. JH292 TaxID=990068 RepID=UPI0004650CBE|nr:glycosyltransferase family 9 protein [Lebetimonas sp. JH292]
MKIGNVLNKEYLQFKNYIGFQVGAADVYKMWPIERFSKLAEKLLKNNEKIVILGTQNEKKLGDKIIQNVGNKNIVNMDTGTMHLAIALKTPTVSLFSATDSKTIGPYQDLELHKVIQKNGSFVQKLPKKQRDNSAMQLIDVNEVFEKYEELNNYLKSRK